MTEISRQDPWVARARPAFLYVMYGVILLSVPVGVLAAVDLPRALAVASGVRAYFAAIPEGVWSLFATGYLGYALARSVDKRGEQTAIAVDRTIPR